MVAAAAGSEKSATTAASAYVRVGDEEDDIAPGGLRKPLGLPILMVSELRASATTSKTTATIDAATG